MTWEADQKAWSKTWERFTSRIVALETDNAALRWPDDDDYTPTDEGDK